MIQIQIVTIESNPAILASVLVALENIMACKLYLFLREAIEKQ